MLFVVVCCHFGSSVCSEVVKFQRQCKPVIPKKRSDPHQFFTRVVCHHPTAGCFCSLSSVIFFSVLYAPLILYGSAQPVHVYTSGGESDQEQFTKIIPAGMRVTTDFCKRDLVIYISLSWKIQIHYCLRFLKMF